MWIIIHFLYIKTSKWLRKFLNNYLFDELLIFSYMFNINLRKICLLIVYFLSFIDEIRYNYYFLKYIQIISLID